MMPTLRDHNVVLVRKTNQIKRFNIVYFRQGNSLQIRRIIGLPGESIMYQDDTLYVNGTVVEEKFIIDEINNAQRNGGKYTEDFSLQNLTGQTIIPKDCYLVLADNRSYGLDSRQYGLVTEEQVNGVLESILFPFEDIRVLTISKII